MKKPLILISNDDGPFAKGLDSLIEIAKEFGQVIVVVPEDGQSGKSHSITMKYPLRIQKHDNKIVDFYTVNGTPVDSIKLALNHILTQKPDLVLSGINHGSNAAVSVIYSGTMGVALEAALHNIPAIGFSLLNHHAEADFTLSKEVVRKIVPQVMKHSLPDNLALNVNIPDIKPSDFKGIAICRQTNGVWSGEFEKRIDPHGKEYFWMTGHFSNHDKDSPETDEYALSRNMATIVPVKPDFTDKKSIELLKNWSFE
jgi:5'-nucleotidase